uniref:Uncharacterized protein LOC104215188 n=1 Tax=Nicotiana sylvestris TaxID=4096 RepID=A0A1U7VLP4_NICSY|nr:PREDICTED: uncharacterized protein LOC104215188 [Nicotiana sylvestris]
MANEQSSPSPVINTTPASLPSLTSPPETHSFTLPDTTVPISISSSSPIAFTPPSNPISLPCVANASEVSEEDPDQYLNSSVLVSKVPTESPEKEAAQNIMAIAAESLMNEGASPLPKSQGEETPFLGDERTMILFESLAHDPITKNPIREPDSLSSKINQEPIVSTKPLESIPPTAASFDEDDMVLSARFKIRKPEVTPKSSSKRPTTRLQKKEEFESTLQKMVEVDEDVVEEPISLVKRSIKVQKFMVEVSEEVVEKQSGTSVKSGGKSKKVMVEKYLSKGDTVAVASSKGKSVEMSRK